MDGVGLERRIGPAYLGGSGLLVGAANWLLPGPGSDHVIASVLGAALIAWSAAFAFAERSRRRIPKIVYVLGVFTALATLGTINATLGAAFGGLFTIAFIMLGLQDSQRTVLLALPPAGACWYLANGGTHGVLESALVVRLPIAIAIWATVGVVLARHSRQVEQHTTSLTAQAHLDPLTGLANRRALGGLLKTARPGASLVLLDLDHFKAVNDTYGHLAGDKLLRAFAAQLRASLRAGDIAIRYGGEEFLLFLPNTTAEQTETILSRLKTAWLESGPATTFSAGAADLSSSRGVVEALGLADHRLYAAKTAGRNRWVVDDVVIPVPRQAPIVTAF